MEENAVKFADAEVAYIIGRQYLWRPRFEDDDDIVNAFTELAELKRKRKELVKELSKA